MKKKSSQKGYKTDNKKKAKQMIIDSHDHWVPESFVRNVEKFLWKEDSFEHRGGKIDIWRHGQLILPGLGEEFYSAESRLKAMDQAGIDKAVLSADGINEWLNIELSREVNDEMASFVKKHPDRFMGLASVPPEDEGCVEEMDRAIKQLGLKGISIATHSLRKGLPIDAKEFRPFYQKVNELDVPIAIHPANLPLEDGMFRDYDLARTFGRAVSVTLSCLRLFHSDLVEEFPKLRFLLPHLGGTFFSMKDRMLGSFFRFGGKPSNFESRLDHFYFDTAPPYWPKASMDCALATLGPKRILFGTDYPLGPEYLSRGIAMAEGWHMNSTVRKAVLCENARNFWKI
jgi:predicted TIM-barrel fold metal-dependent hydrolase